MQYAVCSMQYAAYSSKLLGGTTGLDRWVEARRGIFFQCDVTLSLRQVQLEIHGYEVSEL